MGTVGPSPSRTQLPGPEGTFPHLDFSPIASLLLTQLHKLQGNYTISHCKPLGDRSRWRRWGREEARLRLAKQKAESGKENVSVFKLRGMLHAWELILKETQTFLLPADLACERAVQSQSPLEAFEVPQQSACQGLALALRRRTISPACRRRGRHPPGAGCGSESLARDCPQSHRGRPGWVKSPNGAVPTNPGPTEPRKEPRNGLSPQLVPASTPATHLRKGTGTGLWNAVLLPAGRR